MREFDTLIKEQIISINLNIYGNPKDNYSSNNSSVRLGGVREVCTEEKIV